MQGVHIDQATQADIPRLLEIRHAAFSSQAPSAYSPAQVETLLGEPAGNGLRAMISNSQLFVARSDGTVVGLAGWQGASLRHVCVDPDHTRQGIATRLLSHVEADFRHRTGASLITAEVVLHAELFYLASGYEIIRGATDRDGSEYLEMVKRF